MDDANKTARDHRNTFLVWFLSLRPLSRPNKRLWIDNRCILESAPGNSSNVRLGLTTVPFHYRSHRVVCGRLDSDPRLCRCRALDQRVEGQRQSSFPCTKILPRLYFPDNVECHPTTGTLGAAGDGDIFHAVVPSEIPWPTLHIGKSKSERSVPKR